MTSNAPLWQGWSAPRPVPLLTLEAALCAAHDVRPERLHGSRIGKLTLFRSILLAIAVDVTLTPPALCARRYGLTPAGVVCAVDRARAQLRAQPELRWALAGVLCPLGFVIPC